MVPIICSVLYGLILLTAFSCAVILLRPLRALYSEVVPKQRQGDRDTFWRRHITTVVAGLVFSASLNACARLVLPLK